MREADGDLHQDDEDLDGSESDEDDEAWKSLVQEDFSNVDFECDECKKL